jgi:F-type H+-transporting ATPase subunit b
MGIDGFIVVAQIINFLVLVLVLRLVLYRPLLRLIRERQERIRSQWQEAEHQREQARRESERQQQLRRDLEQQHSAGLEQVRRELERERQSRSQALRDELDEQRRRWQDDLERQQRGFLDGLRADLVQQGGGIARRALADLASVELEEQIVDTLLARLRDPEPGRRPELERALAEGGQEPLVLLSGFPLAPPLRRKLLEGLRQRFPSLSGVDVAFARDPALLCGIEIRRGGQAIGWNLEAYLDGLERRLAEALHPTGSHAAARP